MERKTLLKVMTQLPGDVFAPVIAFDGADVTYLKINRSYLTDVVKAMPEGETGYRFYRFEDGRILFEAEADAVEKTLDAEIEEKVDLAQAPTDEELQAILDEALATDPKDPIRDVPYAGNFDYEKREFKAA